MLPLAAWSDNITFADSNVKAICVQNWDTDDDGELSEAEASAVNTLGQVFTYNTDITSFNELQHFTGLTNIGDNAFSGCSSLTSVIIPANIKSIGNNAFSGCERIENLIIPDGVQTIKSAAFAGLERITSLHIPQSVTSIEYSMGQPFYYCKSLQTITVDENNQNYDSRNNCNAIIEKSTNTLVAGCVNTTIPNGTKIIGKAAFYGSSFESVSLPSGITTIGSNSFSNCEYLKSITIPSGVTLIDEYAFSYCPQLESISLPNSLKTIGFRAFSTNSNYLKTVVIPEGVETIGNIAFENCYALESVTLPSTLTSHFNSTFEGCSQLTEVYVYMSSPNTIQNELAFPNSASATLYVPAGSKAAYEAADYWKEFKEIQEFGYMGKVDSELTGVTDISCFRIVQPGTLQNIYVNAGKPRKVKIIGNVSPTDLEALSKDGYQYEMHHPVFVDLSEANIQAGSYYDRGKNKTVNTPEGFLNADWLGCINSENDDSSWYGPETIVLPNSLTEFEGWAQTIYSTQTIPFNTTVREPVVGVVYGVCKFYVPSGTKTAWEELTTDPDKVMFYDGPVKGITVQTAGTLKSLLTSQEIATINELTVKGTINAVDFATMKNMKSLSSLAIEANIAAYEGSEGPFNGYTSYRLGEIPAETFQNNVNLKSVSVFQSSNIKGLNIGDYAFDGCTNLSSFNCEGFSSLGDFCFRNTKVMGGLLLGATFTYSDDEDLTYSENNREFEEIGLQPFFGVKGGYQWDYARYKSEIESDDYDKLYVLKNFSVIPSYYSNRSFFSGITNKDENLLYSISTTKEYSLVLPNSITTLADYAVSGLQLKSINLNAVTTIGDGLLYQCPLLQSIICDNTAFKSVDGVLYSADQKSLIKYPCANVAESLTIPASVNMISKWAFEGSKNLRTIKIEATAPPTLDSQAFDEFNVAEISLYVPAGCKADYEAADYWKEFKEIVEVREIWSGKQIIKDWNSLFIEKEKLSDLKVGDLLHVTVKDVTEGATTENWMVFCDFRDGDWTKMDEWKVLAENTKEVTYLLTGDILHFIKDKGMLFTGSGYTVTQVYTTETVYTGSGNSIWVGNQTADAANISIEHLKNANDKSGLRVDDIIRLTFAGEGGDFNLYFMGEDTNWQYQDVGEIVKERTETGADVRVTQGMVDMLSNNLSALVVGVENITLTQVELIQNSWFNIAVNSDMEGTDNVCFLSRENRLENDEIVPSTIVEGAGVDGSRGIVIQSAGNPTNVYDTQFFFRLPQALPAGTKYRISFDYKASQEASCNTEIHADPGTWISSGIGTIDCTTDWKHFELRETVSAEQSPADNPMRTVAFCLAATPTSSTYYFDNIVFEIDKSQITPLAIVAEAPTAKEITFTGEAQELVNPGRALFGAMQYSLDGTNYSSNIPTGIDVGEYTIYYKVVGDEEHDDTEAATVSVTIEEVMIEETDISLLDNAIFLERTEGLTGGTVKLNIQLKNPDYNPVGCSFRLTLPEGFTLKKDEYGELEYEIDSRARRMSVISTEKSEGIYNFVLTPASGEAVIDGIEGTVLTLTMVVPEDAAVGEHAILLTRNLVQREVDGAVRDAELSDVVAICNVDDYLPGDVNADNKITPSDAIMILYHYFEIAQSGFVAKAADVNQDGNISPADAIQNLLFYFSNDSEAPAKAFWGETEEKQPE